MPWYNFNFEQQFNLIPMPCPFKDQKKKILLHPYSNQSQFMGYQGWDEILMIALISRKIRGVNRIMRNTVRSIEPLFFSNTLLNMRIRFKHANLVNSSE
jgi:hypothetical protein